MNMNQPNKIIIHHSATKDGLVLKDWDAIRKYHIETNGWLDVGYHYGVESVDNQYQIMYGRPTLEEGAHCLGQNDSSIGICMLGDFTYTPPTEAQYQTAVDLIKDIIYPVFGELPVYRHDDFYATSCPGKLDVQHIRDLINAPVIVPKTWKDYVKEVSPFNFEEWCAGIDAAVNMAKAQGDLGALEIFEYLPTLIEKMGAKKE
jgi:hypothetical protein